MSYFLGMEILTGIVDGKLKFCVIEDQGILHATAGEADGKHFPVRHHRRGQGLHQNQKRSGCHRQG